MKKRLWSLLLCLVLVCSMFAGCGDKEENDKEESGKKETVSEGLEGIADAFQAAVSDKPEEMVTSRIKAFSDLVTDALTSAKTETVSTESAGLDMKIVAEIGQELASNYGLDGLESVGLNIGMDVKDLMEMRIAGQVALNGKEELGMDMIMDSNMFYVNLPDYSPDYMGMDLSDTMEEAGLGSAAGISSFNDLMKQATEGMPSADDVLKIWKDFSEGILDCFEYQDVEKNVTVGYGDYTVSGDKYVTAAKMSDVQKVMEKTVEQLKQFPQLEVGELDMDFDSEVLLVNYIKGDKDTFAWEFAPQDNPDNAHIYFVSTEKGVTVYAEEDGEKEIVIYSVKESDKKGQIFIADGEDVVIKYDNFSNDHIDIEVESEEASVTASIDTAGDKFKVDFSIEAEGAAVSGSLSVAEKEASISASVSYQGMKLGTVKLDLAERAFNSYSVPDSYLDANSWAMGLDQEKLMQKLQDLMTEYPFIANLAQSLN